jgi:hypothetical protein
MVECGIRGIWNFAPAKLKLRDGVIVLKEDLAEGLAVLTHRICHAAPGFAHTLNKRPARSDSRAPLTAFESDPQI